MQRKRKWSTLTRLSNDTERRSRSSRPVWQNARPWFQCGRVDSLRERLVIVYFLHTIHISFNMSLLQQVDESKAMNDLNSRIQQLTKLILTSATVDESKGEEGDSRPVSPVKIDFDMSPYQLQQELLAARLQMESQANQILSLEASLLARPALPADAKEDEKDKLIAEQAKTIRELEIVVRGYEETLGEPLRKVKEDVEKEWSEKLDEEKKKSEQSERWAEEVVKALEKEKKVSSPFFL